MKIRLVSPCAFVVSLPLISASGIAEAQSQEPSFQGLEEIVVTSRRISENMQSTPISVSAFRTEDLEKLHVERIGEIAAYTPNFSTIAGPTGHNDAFFFIRGIGQTDLNAAADPAVGVYIDGVYLGRVVGASFDSLDIARVEVLRGPQGTLFGRNTMGGAVSVTTADPTEDFSGQIMLGGGDRDLQTARASLSVPFSDTFGVALSGLYKTQDGWSKSIVNGKTFDDVDDQAARIKFLWQPNEKFSARLGADISRSRGTSQSQILAGFNPAGASPFGVPKPPQIAADLSTDPYENRSSTLDPKYSLDASGVNLTLTLGPLTSITAYREVDQDVTSDFDASRYNFYQSLISTRQHQFSQELQLAGDTGRLKWLLGGYYYDEGAYHNNGISLGGNNGCLPVPPVAIPPGNPWPSCFVTGQPYATALVDRVIVNNQQFNIDIEALAAFAHATIALADRWSASLGLRWTEETKTQAYDYFIDNTDGVASFAGFPAIILPTLSPRNPNVGVPTTYEKTWSDVTPKLGLEYQATPDLLYYISYSEGFKSGGFNGRVQPNQQGRFPQVKPYDPEHLKAVEVGFKSEWLDRRVRLNTSLFGSRYEDIQLLILNAQTGFFENANGGQAELYGIEVDLLAQPVSAFELNAGIGYIDHEYTELSAGAATSGITKDSKLPGTPEWSGSLGMQYTWQMGSAGVLALRGDYSYRSKVFFNAVNGPLENGDDVGLVNARATYTLPSGSLSFSAYVLNATDEVYVSNGQDVTAALGVAFNSIGPPREWGIEAAYRFGK